LPHKIYHRLAHIANQMLNSVYPIEHSGELANHEFVLFVNFTYAPEMGIGVG